jgi:hypothetical protein
MKRNLTAVALFALVVSLAGCSNEPAAINADSTVPAGAPAAIATPAASAAPAVVPVADEVKPEPKITVPAGTKLRVALLEAVSSDKSHVGDLFLTSLTAPVVVGGKTVLPKGTKVRGRVVDASGAGRVQGRASIQLTLTQIVVGDDKSISISTKPSVQGGGRSNEEA